MIALMITVLAIAWALSVLLAKGQMEESPGHGRWPSSWGPDHRRPASPTNTWDFYTYMISGHASC